MLDKINPPLRVVGGHPALDLVNTVAPRLPGSEHVEFLPGPPELLAWTRRVGILDGQEASEVEAAWLAGTGAAMRAWRATIEIREALYSALAARRGIASAAQHPHDVAAAALDRIALHWAAMASRCSLVPGIGEHAAAARLVVGPVPAFMVPDRLVHLAVELLRQVDLGQLRSCPTAEGGCGWLFLDRSRNGSRRWCAMEDCGSQAKSRRLTARRRAGRATVKKL